MYGVNMGVFRSIESVSDVFYPRVIGFRDKNMFFWPQRGSKNQIDAGGNTEIGYTVQISPQ